MKASELKTKSVEELKATLLELREKQFKMRMKRAAGQLTATHEIAEVRKDIARAKTVLRQIQGK